MTVHATSSAAPGGQYEKIATRLAKQAGREIHGEGSPPHASPAEIVDWLIARKPTIAKSTWRIYKASINDMLLKKASAEAIAARGQLLQEKQTGAIKRSARTSALKRKALPPEDLGILIRHLHAHPSRSHQLLVYYLVAGIVTGLRTGEWAFAQWVDPHPETGGAALVVRNAKSSQGRGNGSCRTIHLVDGDEMFRSAARVFQRVAARAAAKDRFPTMVGTLRKALSRAVRKLWPTRSRHITMYSTRHQAAANFKACLAAEAVAALLGHASAETAATHYARRQAGRTTVFPSMEGEVEHFIPAPSPAEVATVRQAKPWPWGKKAEDPAPTPSP